MDRIYLSKYSIAVEMQQKAASLSHVIANTFTGSIDYCDAETARIIIDNDHNVTDGDVRDMLLERGYAYRSESEEADKVRAVCDISRKIAKERKSVRAVFLTTYSCNLNCGYCYQRKLKRKNKVMTNEMISSVFQYISEHHSHVAGIDVIGGEPLLPTAKHEESIRHLLKEAESRGLKIRVITNGTNLGRYIPLLRGSDAVDFIQVTIDGPLDVHNSRRTDDKSRYRADLFETIRLALHRGLRIAARTNVDTTNIECLPRLYREYERRGFLDSKGLFFPYISPVHEHNCQSCSAQNSELAIIEKLFEMEERYPEETLAFNRSNFLIYQYLKNVYSAGRFTFPRFYRCEANTNQLVFDPCGHIYGCIEAAGNEEYKIGDYTSGVTFSPGGLDRWRREREVIRLEGCMSCELCFMCGGNCSWAHFMQGPDVQRQVCEDLKKSVELFFKKRGHQLMQFAADGAGSPEL